MRAVVMQVGGGDGGDGGGIGEWCQVENTVGDVWLLGTLLMDVNIRWFW